ncbi:hypothetical protein [Methanobacterium oryzae]|uniref:hypothetical protein n=1 Tax=Methanobacterium oryzae TaxID=69540 RepID=UPI003D1CEB8E
MASLNSFYSQNSERKALSPFEIEKKVFYPIIDISIIYNENIFYNAVIVPIAFVVEENREKYIIYLTNEEIDDNILFSIISTYKKDNK